MTYKALSTQALVNAYPPWSNTRIDEQSLGYQFLNVFGLKLDDLRKQNFILGNNFYLPTSNVSDIDVYYRVKLPDSYTFVKQDDDDTELIFTPPTVSGVLDDNIYPITVAEENTVESFWYSSTPDRISLNSSNESDFLISSGYGYAGYMPLLISSGLISVPNKLYVTMSGGRQYIDIDDNNNVNRTLVQLEGTTRAGLDIVEEVPFISDGTESSFHEFRSINVSGIRVFGPENRDDVFIKVESALFNHLDYPVAFDLGVTIDKQEMPLFWSLERSSILDRTVLSLKKHDVDDVVLRSEGFSDKSSILEQELLNVSGVAVSPSDLAVQPNSDFLWMVDEDTLYVYNSKLPYSDNTLLLGKDYDAHSAIEPSSYFVLLGEDVQLDYVWRRPVQGMVKHRVSVLKPDGTQKSIEGGAEVTYHTGSASWIFGEPVNRSIRESDIFALDQRGHWVYTLEVQYADETTSLDRRVITVLSNSALAQYSLSAIGISNSVSGIDFDSEHKLWVLDSQNTRYEIGLHYNNMIIDFERKFIYLRENFDQVRVY